MRGRKPHPTSLKLLHNNPGRRPMNTAEPTHDPIDPVCPPDLTDPVAQAEWLRIATTLNERQQVSTVDRATLMGYCLKYGQWLALEAEAAKHPFLVKAPSGYPIGNPALSMANKAFGLMLKAAAELGITPSSRSRVAAFQATTDNAFDDFQRQRPPMLARVK